MKALVIFGDGINCERETAHALKLSGFRPEIVHLNDLIHKRLSVDALSQEYRAIAFPGGFSFGDDLSSGKVLALKIKHGLKWNLNQFAERGGVVIGICNGFQALIRMGVFGAGLSITQNEGGKFIDRWMSLKTESSPSVWLKGIDAIDLPIRHGEGRIVVRGSLKDAALNPCLKYDFDINGSAGQIAGLSDSTGRILGLMPHPEAFVRKNAHPDFEVTKNQTLGLELFLNAYREVKSTC
jgi:phosphoribosylformylglycinamidine synthase